MNQNMNTAPSAPAAPTAAVVTVDTLPTGTWFAIDHPDGVQFHPSMEQALRFASDGKCVAYYSETELRAHTAAAIAQAVGEAYNNGRYHRELDEGDAKASAPVAAMPKPFAFVILNEHGGVEFSTSTHDEAQAHINDAISEHDIEGAGKWRSIPAYEMRPSDDKLWDQTMRERDYNAEIADKLADAIGEYFGAEIGEHSSSNCPWLSALTVIEEAPPFSSPQQHAQAALSDEREALDTLYNALPDILPEGAHLRLAKTGKWASDRSYALRGHTGEVKYRADDMECVYAAMDQARAILATRQPAPASVKDHVLREVVNSLRDTAIRFHSAQQLRERLRGCLDPLLASPVAAAVAECEKCNGQGATHYPDGEWEGKCATCKGTDIQPPAEAAPVDAKPAALEQLHIAAAQYKMALVPLHLTRSMQEVLVDEWEWEDLLAAAEAITEEQYAEVCAGPSAAQRRVEELEYLLEAAQPSPAQGEALSQPAAAGKGDKFDISTPMHIRTFDLNGMLVNYRAAATSEKVQEFKVAIIEAVHAITQQGRAAGIEEAAKLWDGDSNAQSWIARAIRALNKGG